MTPPPPPPPPGNYGPPSGAASQWGTLAEFGPRALGYLIDGGIVLGAFVVVFIVALILGAISSALGLLIGLVGYLAVVAVGVWFAVQVGQTGSSPGMRLIGLKCVGLQTGQPIGGGMGFVRSLAHIVDNIICYIGWLFPLWDAQKQTLADKIMSTVVIVVPAQPFSIGPPA